MKVERSLSSLNLGQQSIFNLGMGINLVMGALDVYKGLTTPGDFVMVQTLFMRLAGPMFTVGNVFRQAEETNVDLQELHRTLNRKPQFTEKEDAKEFTLKEGGMKIKNLHFSHYIPDGDTVLKKTLLKNFNLEIEPGTTNAIVGSSGFGKTTFFNLLFRIY